MSNPPPPDTTTPLRELATIYEVLNRLTDQQAIVLREVETLKKKHQNLATINYNADYNNNNNNAAKQATPIPVPTVLKPTNNPAPAPQVTVPPQVAVTPQVAARPHPPKSAKPQTFSGKPNAMPDIDTWLFKMEERIKLEGLDTTLFATQWAATFLVENAEIWWRSVVEEGDASTWDWDTFKYEIEDEFKVVNKDRMMRDKLHDLKQDSKSISDYIAEFRSIVRQVKDLTDTDKKDFFFRGLRKDLQLDLEAFLLHQEDMSFTDFVKLADRHGSAEKYRSKSINPRTQETPRPWIPRGRGNLHYPPPFNPLRTPTPTATRGRGFGRATSGGRGRGMPSIPATPSTPKPVTKPLAYPQTGMHNMPRRSQEEMDLLRAQGRCFRCGEQGHRSDQCAGAYLNNLGFLYYDVPEEDYPEINPEGSEYTSVSNVSSPVAPSVAIRDNSTNLLIVNMKLLGRKARVLIDGGAQGNFVSSSFVRNIGARTLQRKDKMMLHLADGSPYSVCDRFVNGVLKWPSGKEERLSLDVTKIGYDIILGKPWLTKHNAQVDWVHNKVKIDDQEFTCLEPPKLPERVLSAIQFKKLVRKTKAEVYAAFLKFDDPKAQHQTKEALDEKVRAIIQRFSDVFPADLPEGLPPKRDEDHAIDVETNQTPPLRPMIRLSQAEQQELEKQLAYLIGHGFIRPSKSPYGAPVLFARKKDGTLRMCIDYRALNKITVKNRYPLPRIDDIFDGLQGSIYFTRIDLASAYWQIRIKEEDIPKTAFRTKQGHYEFLVLTFGMTNAPATFQSLINRVLRPVLGHGVLAYLDDIIIYSKTKEEHYALIEKVLSLLREDKLYARLSKCEFLMEEIEFLGHTVSGKGIHTDPKKTKAISEWPRPNSTVELQQFLGLCNYYRRFIRRYSHIAAPLTDLTKNVPFYWSDTCEQAFKALKLRLVSAPVLIMPDTSKAFRVEADSSIHALGCVLLQEHEGKWHPVAFESRKLKPAESRYPTHERELLALVHALKVWRHYLLGNPFIAKTDHKSICELPTQPHLSGRQARWVELLQAYQVTFEYKPGLKMIVADALSRSPLLVNGVVSKPILDWTAQLKEGYDTDPLFKQIKQGLLEPLIKVEPRIEATLHRYKYMDELLYYENRLCIPSSPAELRQTIIQDMHDSPIGGHVGRTKLYLAIRDRFYWPHLERDIHKYTTSCDECQRSKVKRWTAGKLSPLPIPERKWQIVTMDFLTSLPTTKRGNNVVMVVVDKLGKMAHFIPTNSNATAPDVASLYYHFVFKYHGMPEIIISDRDPKFTSIFWTSLFKMLGTKLNMSTANHPQTDGQSERTIQTIEQYLRIYINYAQDDWDEHLTAAEFAFNNSVSAATQMTPFFMGGGEHPLVPVDLIDPLRPKSDTPSVEAFVSKIQSNLKLAQDRLKEAQDIQKAYADKTRKMETFNVGDLVLVPTTHFLRDNVAQRPNASLRHPYVGPFKVVDVISPVTYRLRLPPTLRGHPVVHVSILKKYNPRDHQPILPPPPEVASDISTYEVERIVDVRKRYGKKQYLVKWKNYPDHDNTWLPLKNLDSCGDLIKLFYRQKQGYVESTPNKTPLTPLAQPSPIPVTPQSPIPPSFSPLAPANHAVPYQTPALPIFSPLTTATPPFSSLRTTNLKKEDSVMKETPQFSRVSRKGRRLITPRRLDL